MSRAEVIKLARLLGVAEQELAALRAAPPDAVRELRGQVTDRLFDADGSSLRRIADAARVIPVPLVAEIGRRAFGPLLCARLAGLLDPPRAVEIGSRWPDEFTAAVAAEMDPRRASAVVAAMSVDRIVAIARILAREGEDVPMGRFVGHLDGEALRACVAAVDDETVLRTAYVLEEPDRIEEMVAGLSDERLADVAAAGVANGLGEELAHVRAHLSKRQARRLDAAIAAAGG